METLTNAIGLWAASFGSGMINILDSQVKLIFMTFSAATVLRPSIGE